MTIPYMMNCGHSARGWCAECVKEMGKENLRLRAALIDIAENISASMSSELCFVVNQRIAKAALND